MGLQRDTVLALAAAAELRRLVERESTQKKGWAANLQRCTGVFAISAHQFKAVTQASDAGHDACQRGQR